MTEELPDFKTKTCSECGHPVEHVHGDYEFELAFPIKLVEGELLKCPECGHIEPAASAEALIEGVIIGLITKRTRLAGPEVHAVRKYLRLEEREFARAAEIPLGQLAKVESGEMEITLTQNRLIKALLVGLGSDLGEERLQRFMRDELPTVKVGLNRRQRGRGVIRGK